jgi:hypothetical protein
MTDKTSLFNAADYLETPEEIAAGAGRRIPRQGHD